MKMITRYINWRSPSAPAGSLCCLGRQQSPKWTSNGLYASLTSFKDIIKFSLVQLTFGVKSDQELPGSLSWVSYSYPQVVLGF
ncbi:hypothetical protein BT69DRAFT_572874 [Atractiella rhizophila]|nr:hypothetical protein BT69DRAFT_572874 [Atractiella rhizophila]